MIYIAISANSRKVWGGANGRVKLLDFQINQDFQVVMTDTVSRHTKYGMINKIQSQKKKKNSGKTTS